MRLRTLAFIAMYALASILPAWAAKLVDAPPPPPIPDAQLEEDGTPKKPALPDTSSRGRLLYENHCMACHESMVHIRTVQKVKSLPALRVEIVRWALNANLPWGAAEVEEVARYLDSHYYHFQ